MSEADVKQVDELRSQIRPVLLNQFRLNIFRSWSFPALHLRQDELQVYQVYRWDFCDLSDYHLFSCIVLRLFWAH